MNFKVLKASICKSISLHLPPDLTDADNLLGNYLCHLRRTELFAQNSPRFVAVTQKFESYYYFPDIISTSITQNYNSHCQNQH